jgi:GTPase SAR1 family protein
MQQGTLQGTQQGAQQGTQVALSLISHTNAGKTTLARTLLARDVGEVRDAPHVTEFNEDHVLVTSPFGDVLTLWDTPGFGDSVRLVKRLRAGSNPLGWFMTEVWDRFRDRAFYASQQAMHNVRDNADVVLYLVNASETPESAGYIEPEMQLLAWMDKPVVVLLNQLGAPREATMEAADLDRWRKHLSTYPHVREVMALDAFARCWVQEFHWLQAVQAALPTDKHDGMKRLRQAWQRSRMATFDAAMQDLSQCLATVAVLREPLPEASGVRGTMRQLGAAVSGLWKQALPSGAAEPTNGDAQDKSAASLMPAEAQAAQKALSQRTDSSARESLARLINMHGLDGRAHSELTPWIAQHFDMKLHVNEGKAAMMGGAVAGALGGLAADVASAGLTLGGGMLSGAVLGAVAAAGAARGVNVMRGRQASWLTWSPAAMDAMVVSALLRYLAVAHFGRGRGEWQQADAPAHWRSVVQAVLAPQQSAWASVWQQRAQRDETAPESVIPALQAALQPLLRQAALDTLDRLYPGSLVNLRDPTPEPSTAPSESLVKSAIVN